jgi:hypothetical protein
MPAFIARIKSVLAEHRLRGTVGDVQWQAPEFLMIRNQFLSHFIHIVLASHQPAIFGHFLPFLFFTWWPENVYNIKLKRSIKNRSKNDQDDCILI